MAANRNLIAENRIEFIQQLRPNYVELSIVDNLESFKALRSDWTELIGRSEDPNPFLLWEWMYTWWETFATSKNRLCIILLQYEGKLTAIAPLQIVTTGSFFGKTLRPIGSGEPVEHEVVSEYFDVIAEPNFKEVAIEAFADYLKAKKHLWDSAIFPFLFSDSIISNIQNEIGKLINPVEIACGYRYRIKLQPSFEGYVASLSKSTRKQYRSRLRRIQKAGQVEVVSMNDTKDIEFSLSILEKLHRQRWDGILPYSSFDSELFTGFHKSLCKRLLHRENVDIRVMHLNDTPIAAVYNFYQNKTAYSYQSGFSCDNENRFSPMLVFDFLEIERLTSKGYQYYDLLNSTDEAAYKKRFGANADPMFDYYWFQSSTKANLFVAFQHFRRMARKTKRWIKRSLAMQPMGATSNK